MGKEIKLLYPFANVMGIFFPVGKKEDGGTCEFATETCLKKCCAIHKGNSQVIDIKSKLDAYTYFCVYGEEWIIIKILSELVQSKCNMITWFASGDCPSHLTDKFSKIVTRLDECGIIQTGVTRNKELWKNCNYDLSKNAKILLTIEKIEDADGIDELPKHKLYSIPNYKDGGIDILKVTKFNKHFISSGCGGGYYEYHIAKSEKSRTHLKLDCKNCYNKKIGCFSK